MIFRRALLAAAVVLFAGCSESPAPSSAAPQATAPVATIASAKLSYPTAKTVDQIDDYFGVKVADPYRWMEDLDAPDLKTWIEAENKVTSDYLADTPRDVWKTRLTALWNYERFGVPVHRGGRYFYTRNDGLQNQAPVYVQDSLDAEPRLLIDPNTLSADGTIALSEWKVSDDGKRFAYALSDGGSDWRTIKVRDIDSGKDLDDIIEWAKFTDIAWNASNDGFYYSRYDAPQGENQLKAVNKYQKVYFHQLGKPQADDALVFERRDQPDWGFTATTSDDGRYLLIAVSDGTDERNLVFYKDLRDRSARVRELVTEFEAVYDFVGNEGDTFYFRTDNGAERSRIVATQVGKAGKPAWREVVSETDGTLVGATSVGGKFIANYLRDAHSVARVHALDGKLIAEIALPGLGTVTGLEGGPEDHETFFAYTSFVAPQTIYRYDLDKGESTVFKAPKIAFDPDTYETTQTFYNSKDGTRVPLFITAKKGIAKDGANPTILYGYGGFNIPVTPTFSASNMAWLERGGIYAVANLRGGGEYGKAWHQGGMKTHKQNVFDDFATAAEYLIAEKYTTPKKLAISGRSNGGLLVGATLLQRPELFGAALPAVGVLDMLRFRDFTIGWAWESDYGSVKNEDEFKAIYAYSPLHNIKSGVDYPPTLVTTADHDDRVFPAHSFKYAATLQKAYGGTHPILIRVETRAGHGAGKPTSKIIEETTDIFAFLGKALDIK